MNPLTKFVILLTLVGSVVAGVLPTERARGSGVMAHLRASASQVVEQVADEARTTVVTSLSVVRLPTRARTAVFVEGNHMIIEARRFDVLKVTDVIAELRSGALRL